jgi:hypothetical protein
MFNHKQSYRYLRFILFLGFIFSWFVSFSQGEIDDQSKIFYRNERTFALGLNSNGISFKYRYAVRINAFRHRIYDLDISNLKNVKEVKSVNPYAYSSGRFVYGKLNNFYAIRADYGYQKEIYRKRDIGGLSIRRNYSFGPTLGLLKPIYYQIVYSPSEVKDEKLDVTIHQPTDIIGTASFFKGMSEIIPNPGAHIKYSYSFEYSKRDEIYRSLDAGVIADVFLYPPKIMALTTNNQYFVTLFLNFRFGKVIDSRLSKKMAKLPTPIEL